MKPNIGISDQDREAVCSILNRTLADEYVLYTKTRNFHWNVTGSDFAELHKFFEAQYEELNESADEVAERVRQLGGASLGTLREFIEASRLEEEPGQYPDAKTMIQQLLNDHENLIRSLREDQDACDEEYNDMGTSDFLTGLMEQHEKMAWMLRSFLEERATDRQGSGSTMAHATRS